MNLDIDKIALYISWLNATSKRWMWCYAIPCFLLMQRWKR